MSQQSPKQKRTFNKLDEFMSLSSLELSRPTFEELMEDLDKAGVITALHIPIHCPDDNAGMDAELDYLTGRRHD